MDGVPLLPDVFAESVRRHGERVAVDVPPGPGRPARHAWTYAQLAAAAHAVAASLQPFVRAECVVAIRLPRDTPLLLAAQLGVQAAGGAWTCIDASFPTEHAALVLRDSRAVVVLTDPAGCAWLGPHAGGVPLLDVVAAVRDAPLAPAALPRPAWLDARTLAYVIYTSGTTGRPKGVLLEHGGVANLVASDVELFGLGPADRVAQGSSPAYDSSVEETWLALAVGATLVVMDDATARLGPDLVPWLRAERISVLCPPPTQLRATGCERPLSALPDLRLVYVGGEALPQDLADRWSQGRWLENGYGPTECTVTVMRTRVRPGRPVTIGTPLRGHRAFVLDERLAQVPDGEAGELCIGGPGLARGYLGRPDLTAAAFVDHPRHGRLYRTGDLVRRDAAGDHHYLGRIDAQVKLRGHRIELEAIETILAGAPRVRAAACAVQGEGAAERLAAFVVPVDPSAPPDLDLLAERLRASLPPVMVPQRVALLPHLPTTAGGKLDRSALPTLDPHSPRTDRPFVRPTTDREQAIAEAMQATLASPAAVSAQDDFFLDLGGTSLTAALLVSRLRRDPATCGLTVRDVYEARTAASLALRAGPPPGEPAPPSRPAGRAGAAPGARPRAATAIQGAFLLLALVAASAALGAAWFWVLPWLLRALGLVPLLLVVPVIGLVLTALYVPLSLGAAVLAKRALVGRYRAARIPVFGQAWLRHWFVQQVAAAVPWGVLQDTVFHHAALRALGARIGRRVHIHRGVGLHTGGWDLLEIGDDVTVCQDASLRVVELADGHVVLGPVTLEDGSTVDVRAGVSAHAALGRGAFLAALSWLAPGERVPAGARYDGVPARSAGPAPAAPRAPRDARTLSPLAHGIATILLRFARTTLHYYVGFLALTLPVIAAYDVDAEHVIAWYLTPPWKPGPVLALVALVALSVPLATWAAALELRCLGRVRPGLISRWGLPYLRVLAKTDAVRSAGRLLSGTLFWPGWLRLAGMQVGRRCEISTIIDVVPECVRVGEETFFADGVYLGGPRVAQGAVEVGATSLGRNTFLGNHAVIPPGTHLPDDVLLGVCTVADGHAVRRGTSWFGLPPFELPRREIVEVDRRLTHEPGALRYATRLVWELARFTLPVLPVLVLTAWLQVAGWAWWRGAVEPEALLLLPAATFAVPVLFALVVVGLKWVLLGRVRPGQHALWSCWCSRWDFLYVAWGAWLRPFLARLEGTLLLALFLRAFGVRVGRRVVLGAGFAQVVDPDMLAFEDDATVASMFQAHSFEDRVLKVDRVHVARGAYVGSAAVLFYGAHVGARTRVAPHSVVMKHERLTDGASYAGCPTVPQARSPRRAPSPGAGEGSPS